MEEVKTLATLDTEQPADSVECFPDGKHIVCATYKLVEPKTHKTSTGQQSRVGTVSSYSLLPKKSQHTEEDCKAITPYGISQISQFTCSAILDLNIYTDSDGSYRVGCAGSNGSVYLLSCDQAYNLIEDQVVCINEDLLCLSLDKESSSGRKMFTSLSSGELCCFDVGYGKEGLDKWKGHEHEAWIIASDKQSSSIVYSGGDDCRLKMWDLRLSKTTPSWVSKRHDMGVTSIQSSYHHHNIFVSGSYDETILFWDKRNKKSPLVSASTGGGVWRLKWHRYNQFRIAAACMYNGFQLFDVSHDWNSVSQISSYNNHDSIAYGIDWCYPCTPTDSAIDYLATCSFYDCSLQLWCLP